MTIRVVVADDQALVRGGFRMIIDARDDLEVVGEAADGARRGARWSRELRPDVVLMDVRMPVMDGIEATRRDRRVAAARPAVLVLTTFDLDEHVLDRAARRGQRVPAQGHPARRARGRRPRRRRAGTRCSRPP